MENNNQYSESSISEFERNKPVKTRQSLVLLIKDVENMQTFDRIGILEKLKTIQNLLEHGK